MIVFNKNGNGAEELRAATSSYYANADFEKIAGIVESVEEELANQIGHEAMDHIGSAYRNGGDPDIVRAAQRTVGYMAVMRYFRLNDISHETDGRKVKMDSDNERRPFEWQLERDDRMHLEEYYRAYDSLVRQLWDTNAFRNTKLYQQVSNLIVNDAEDFEWVTGIAATPHLFLRMVPHLHAAQMYVEKKLGYDPKHIEDDVLMYHAKAATGLRAVALFVQKTEMQILPGGAFREQVTAGGTTKQSTTSMLHDYYQHMLEISEGYVHDMQHRRDDLKHVESQHLTMPENDKDNKYFIV